MPLFTTFIGTLFVTFTISNTIRPSSMIYIHCNHSSTITKSSCYSNKNDIHLLDLLITRDHLIVCDKIMTIFRESIPQTWAWKLKQLERHGWIVVT